MQLIHENTVSPQPETPINLLCVFRDEAILLPHFIDYYKALGVSQFILIDNNSVDGGSDYLKSRQDINIKLFFTADSYRQSYFGTVWQNACMARYCQNQFCIRVDTDELLLLDKRRYPTLMSLIQYMQKNNTNAVPGVLLDIYPEKLNNSYQAGEAFSEHSVYFDKLNTEFYRSRSVLYNHFYWLEGGLRARTLNTYNIIHKFPIVKYNFSADIAEPNTHFFSRQGKHIFNSPFVKLNVYPVVLLHYKFIKPNFLDYVKQQIENDEHWHDSAEYKNYYDALKQKNEISFYDQNYSKKFERMADLEAFWNINISLLI